MKTNVIGFFGRIIYSKNIREFENKIEQIYIQDWRDKKWEDYAIDCVKMITELKDLINNSTGKKRLDYLFGLQSMYNIKGKEISYINNIVQTKPINELKSFFPNEYEIISENLSELDLPSVFKVYSEQSEIINSSYIKSNYTWKYISSCLIISRIEEKYSNELNSIFRNLNQEKSH